MMTKNCKFLIFFSLIINCKPKKELSENEITQENKTLNNDNTNNLDLKEDNDLDKENFVVTPTEDIFLGNKKFKIYKEDKQIYNLWQNSINHDSINFFENMLEVYNYDILGKNTNYVKQIFKNSDKRDSLGSTLFYDESQKSEEVIKKLIRRYPVYFGNPVTSMYKSDVVEKVLGYNPSNNTFMRVHNNIRFSLLGKAYIESGNVNNPNNLDSIYVLHTWGINLEKSNTDDFKAFVNKDSKKINKYEYAYTFAKIIENIFTALQAKAKNLRKNVYLRTNGISLGAFLSSVVEKEKKFPRALFGEFLAYFAKNPKYNMVKVDYCEHVSMPLHDKDSLVYKLKNSKSSNLRILKGGNLFNIKNYSRQDIVVLLNAWDDRSFIGNGGSQDPTTDGYMVAGRQLPNSSYLNNVWFNKFDLQPYKSTVSKSEISKIVDTLKF